MSHDRTKVKNPVTLWRLAKQYVASYLYGECDECKVVLYNHGCRHPGNPTGSFCSAECAWKDWMKKMGVGD